jgi:hypothetical protein
MVDDYVRLDADLGKLLSFLDVTVGKNQYTVFLTADHAVAQIPGFMKEHKLPGGLFDENTIRKELNDQIKEQFGVNFAIESFLNYQVTLNHSKIDSAKADIDAIKKLIIAGLVKKEAVANAVETSKIMFSTLNKTQKRNVC